MSPALRAGLNFPPKLMNDCRSLVWGFYFLLTENFKEKVHLYYPENACSQRGRKSTELFL